MTNKSFPLTPPTELVRQWYLAARAMPVNQWVTDVATAAAQWGADQELEACVEWVSKYTPYFRDFPMPENKLRIARRPKPPSLKEQALAELGDIYNDEKIDGHAYNTIRRALEQLND